MDGNRIPSTCGARKSAVEAAAWLAVLELRTRHAEAALVCDAIELAVDMLAGIAVDREGVHIKVAALTANALRHYGCRMSLLAMLEKIVQAESPNRSGDEGATQVASARPAAESLA
jgi:hypothetical protein